MGHTSSSATSFNYQAQKSLFLIHFYLSLVSLFCVLFLQVTKKQLKIIYYFGSFQLIAFHRSMDVELKGGWGTQNHHTSVSSHKSCFAKLTFLSFPFYFLFLVHTHKARSFFRFFHVLPGEGDI